MRNVNFNLLLLGAGFLLTVAGCQKRVDNHDSDEKLVTFGVASWTPETRTAYSGEGEEQDGKLVWERINWTFMDKLLIWSDNAVNRNNRPGKSAVYYVLDNIDNTSNVKQSKASISRDDEDGLVFLDDPNTAYKFWGLYPANAFVGEKPEAEDAEGEVISHVTFDIPAVQKEASSSTGTDGLVLAPDMTKAVMLAYASIPNEQNVNLGFQPAFTAFEFHLQFEAYKEGAQPITLQKVELSSEKSNLAGQVKATVGSTISYEALVDEENEIAPTKTITYNFPQGGAQLSQTNPITFTVFALPNLVEDLRVTFYYTDPNNSDIPDVRTGVLKYKGSDLSFAACQKHKLTGIFIRENYDANSLKFTLVPTWDKETIDNGSNGGYPQSTQFVVTPSSAVQNAWDDRLKTPTMASTTLSDEDKDAIKSASRQTWEFKGEAAATITYSIILPRFGTWRVEVCGDADAFTVAPLSGNLANSEDAASTKIVLTVTPKGTKNGKIYLKTFVKPTNGNEFSLDSETQLYDLRGYHYFVYNTSHEYTSNYVD